MTPPVLRVDPLVPELRIVERAVQVLRGGGIVAYPTETLYGLGADAFRAEAVAKVRAAKGRSDGKPILLIADSVERVLTFVSSPSRDVRRLMEACWPGPLTLVLPAGPEVPEGVTAGSGTVGVRVPDHPLCRALVTALGSPMTSTSANRQGEATPSAPEDLVRIFGSAVDLYLDGGILFPSPGSTVVDMAAHPPRLLRTGAYSPERLKALLPDLAV